MQINHTVDNDIMTVTIEGAINYDGANDLKQFLDGVYSTVAGMVIDMTKADYVSSAGMRVILEAELQMKKRAGLTLVGVNDLIKDAFHMSGFDRFLNIK